MSLLAWIDLGTLVLTAGVLAFLPKLRIILHFRPGVFIALVALLFVSAIHHLINFLHMSGIYPVFDYFEDYTDILMPVMWGLLFYVLWQDSMANAVREERDRARKYLDIVGVMIVAIDFHRKVTLINKRGCELLGFSEDEIIGKDWFENFIPLSERERIGLIFDEFIKGRLPLGGVAENRILTRDGQERMIYWNNAVLKDSTGCIIGTLSAGQDITEIRRIESALLTTKAHERALIDNLPHLAWVKDLAGRFILVNRPFAEACGFDIKLIIGKTDLDVWPRALAEKYRADDAEVIRTRIKKFVEEPIEQVTGRRWFETYKSPVLDQQGNVIGTTGIARDITERKRFEEELRNSEAKLRQVIDLVPHFIFAKNRVGQFILINKAVADTYGTTVEGLLGKTDGDFNPNMAEVQHFIQDDNEVMDSGQPKDIPEEKITDAKGNIRYLHTYKIPFQDAATGKDAVLGVSTDITERKHAEESLRESEQKYRTLIEAAADAIFVADALTGYIIDANRKAAEMIGLPIEKIIGLHHSELHPKGEAQIYRDYFQKFVQGDSSSKIVGFISSRQRGKIPVQISAGVVDLAGRRILIGIFRDITELKIVEEALRKDKAGLEKIVHERTEMLGKTLKDLEDAKRLSDIGALAATVAHELRNPLGVIKTAVYNIKQKAKDNSFDRHLANIDKKISESELIIKNLLSYAQIKAPAYEKVNALEVLNECIENSRHKFSEFDAEISVRHRGGKTLPIVEVDSHHLSELFANVIDNAYQALPGSKGEILVDLDYNEKEGFCTITVEDNGVGIEKEILPNVFDPFFTTKSKGTGLGLSVCNQIVNLYGGRIDIESVKGKGTKVTLILPIKRKDTHG